MTDDQLIELSKKLIRIESTTDNPDGLRDAHNFMVQMIRGWSKGKDITVEEFESNGKPSLLAYRGKTRPSNFHILFNGHLDVIHGKPEQFKAFVKDDKLFGRGAYDEKAACVILAAVFCELADKLPFDLGVQIVTDEEVGGNDGVLYQIEHGVRADFIICSECGRRTDDYEIANEAKGIAIVEVTLKGNAAHGAYPWRGDNAAVKAATFINALHERFPAPSEESPETTFTVTSMSANGGTLTRIPDSATVRLDIRYAPDDPNFSDRASLKKLLSEVDAEAEFNISLFDSPLYSSPDNPLLLALKKSAEAVEGHEFKLVRRHATSDGRHYGDIGNQACEFGIAGENQHADNEHITLQAFGNYRKTLYKYLSEL